MPLYPAHNHGFVKELANDKGENFKIFLSRLPEKATYNMTNFCTPLD
jgi:hypothetical protein